MIMSIFKAEALSGNAIEVLGQLYTRGPIWDGNICSKVGRGELVRAGLAHHEHGYAFLTSEGVRTAVEWPIADLRVRKEDQWIEKRKRS
jgi:hypothetical protein